MLKTYRDLKFWQNAYKVTLSVVKLTEKLPRDRVSYILVRQVIRSSASVGANIAEGFGRFKGKEYARFIQVSLGSANETDYWLHLLKEIYPRFSMEINDIIMKNEETIKMLVVTLQSLEKKKTNH